MTRQQQRRQQRDMSHSKQRLNRKALPIGEDVPVPAPARLAEPFEHPAIVPAHPDWYRVVRVRRWNEAEIIAEFPTLAAAVVCASNEKWRTVVQDRHGRKHYNSWRELKP